MFVSRPELDLGSRVGIPDRLHLVSQIFFERLLRGRISVGVAGARTLRTHAQASQVVMAPLGRDLLPPGLLGNPASNRRAGPQAAIRRRSLDRRGKFLLLLSGQQSWPLGCDQVQPVIAQAPWAFAVVATNDATGIVFLQADQCRGMLGRPTIGDQCQQVPAPRLHHVRGMAGALRQLGCKEMGMEVGCACHEAA